MQPRRWPLIVVLVVGLGMIAAPLAFGMFSRAPEGGAMIDDFEPYMTRAEIDRFRAYLDEIDAATSESSTDLLPALAKAKAIDEGAPEVSGVATLDHDWPDIEADMGDLLDRMDRNLDNYDAVAALPPFPLFPWFFVVPGVLIVAMAGWALAGRGSQPARRAPLWALVFFGLGVTLAPAAFQMFTRAPQGREMIDDFRPMMTRERVQAVQRYFVTLGVAEGQLRNTVLVKAEEQGLDPSAYEATARFSEQWPTILADFNPMIATMSDNVDNFAAVDALPNFDLFPWFFVIPGVIVLACGAIALRGARREPAGASGDPQPAASGLDGSQGGQP